MRISIILVLLLGGVPGTVPAPQEARVDFNRDVRPILSDNCYKCHGFDADKRKAGLRLDQKESALAELKSGGRAVVPGDAAKSLLILRITHADEEERMPPKKSGKSLTAAQILTLRRWIDQGAEWKPHWAYIPPERPALPAVANVKWCRNPIDRFILARLEKEKIAFSPEADPSTLTRRLSFDLTGLPPEATDLDAAYDTLVDRFLASPHHGERMALMWLDLVRFADSRGFHSDNPRNVGPYRDFVINAFNDNMPFDRFTVEQLAGDLLPDAALAQRVASGYNRLNLTTEEGGAQPKEYAAKSAADRVRNASSVWMGATLGCAECHDHKFDPYLSRDFYRFAAFFADIKEQPIKDSDAGIPVPDEKQAAELRRIDERIVALKNKLETPSPELDAAQAEWERTEAASADPWVTLSFESMASSGGATLTKLEDGSILASGANPESDTYTLTAGSTLKGIRGFRLEVMPHESLPSSGPGRAPNGNFVLTEFKVRAAAPVGLQNPVADYSQPDYPISAALDAKNPTGWALLPHIGKPHSAVFETKMPVEGALTFVLEHKAVYGQHHIGRFRLSATTLKNPATAAAVPKRIAALLAIPGETRTPPQQAELAAYYRSMAPLLKPVRAEIVDQERVKTEFLKTVRKSLVTTANTPRVTRIFPRGDWLNETGEVVTPAIPQFIGHLDTGERRATRLDLAQWLVSRSNPLTARVFVNRLWKVFFGQGITRTLEDIGAQGEWPAHPELLDWLSVEFMESGWNVRHMVKTIVASSAYRQSSHARRDLRESDPQNRLIARQSSFRLDAELVRDNALAISGLLVRRIGGDSVKPHQPAGYWFHLNFPKREWANDKGENAYRRGIYTWWQRTFIHPGMMAFDAPNREECCAERNRSNIPQQALVLLNDPIHVEAARVLAQRVVACGEPGFAARLTWVYRQALSRRPAPEEVRVLEELYRKHRDKYGADGKSAQALISAGPSPVVADGNMTEIAAWTSVARAILNLHETITRP